MAVYSQMINTFRRFHLLKGLFITHPCLWKCLQTFLAIKFHFELLIFFIVFFFLILNNTILILKKNLVLKDYRPVLMVFLLSKNGILHSVLLSVFYALNVLLFLSSALIYLHIVNKKKPKTSVYPPFSLMNLIAIISLWIVRIPILR